MRVGFGLERVRDNLNERNRPLGLWTFGSIRNLITNVRDQFSSQFIGTDTVRGHNPLLTGGELDANIDVNLYLQQESDPTSLQTYVDMPSLRKTVGTCSSKAIREIYLV
jgi:hypothetical protein